MSMINIVPAICKICHTEQFYTIVYSWNSNDKSEYPKNVCKKCGKLLDSGDIDIDNCSPNDRSYLRAINTWTISYPLKRKTAKDNGLNWLEFFTMDEFMKWYSLI